MQNSELFLRIVGKIDVVLLFSINNTPILHHEELLGIWMDFLFLDKQRIVGIFDEILFLSPTPRIAGKIDVVLLLRTKEYECISSSKK